MRLIPESFEKNGWQFRQIERRNQWALFERRKPGGKPHYECVRIRSHNGFKIPGTETMAEPAEIYPSNETWGRDGFTLLSLERGIAKLDEVAATQEGV
jgi:hypothetical protein